MTTCILRLASTCSRRCRHCYFANYADGGAVFVETGTVVALLKQLQTQGIAELHLEGEHPQLSDILRVVRKNGLRCTVSGSASLFHDDILGTVGDVCRQVNFSVDSYLPEVHDAMRNGTGAHKQTLEQIARCHRAGIPTFHWAAISRENCGDIEAHVQFCRDVGSCGIAFLYISPFGNADLSICVPPDEWVAVCRRLASMRYREDQIRIHFEPVFLPVSEIEEDRMRCKCFTKDLIFINPDGLAYPCPLLAAGRSKTRCLGNVDSVDVFHELMTRWSTMPGELSGGSCGWCPAEDEDDLVVDAHRFLARVCYMYWDRDSRLVDVRRA